MQTQSYLWLLLLIVASCSATSTTGGNSTKITSDLVWLEGLGWGALSAVSLPLGTLIGLTFNINQQTRAALMAFGAGALLFASAMELFGHALHQAKAEGADKGPLYVMVGCAVVGGLFFEIVNTIVEDTGSFYRNFSRLRKHMKVFGRSKMLTKLSCFQIFEGVPKEELCELSTKMVTVSYNAGDDISFDIDATSPIYFIMDGCVMVTLVDPDEVGDDAANIVQPFMGDDREPSRWLQEEPSRRASMDISRMVPGASTGSAWLSDHSTTLTSNSPTQGRPLDTMRRTSRVMGTGPLSEGDMFGHLALLSGRAAHCQCKCLDKTTLLQLPRSDLNVVLQETELFKDSVSSLQQAVDSIAGSSARISTLSSLLPHLHPTRFSQGEDISFDIDAWSPLYHITSGEVQIAYTLENDPKEITETLIAGDFLPNALWFFDPDYSEMPSRLNVKVSQDTQAIIVSRKGFDMLMHSSIKEYVRRRAEAQECRTSPRHSPVNRAVSKKGGSSPHMNPLVIGSELAIFEADYDLEAVQGTGTARGTTPSDHPQAVRLQDSALSKQAIVSPWGASSKVAPEVSLDSPAMSEDDEKAVKDGASAAIAIWVGLAIDAFPESLVIGLLCLDEEGVSIAFVAGVFLANLPEALSASVAMRRSGLSLFKIYVMWWSITIETALGAMIAAAAFPSPPHDRAMVYTMHAIEGLAGGAMLTVICETMLPEAFHEGGKVVGMSALGGFLTAMLISTAD